LGILTISSKAQVKENANYIDSLSSKIVGLKEELVKIQDNYFATYSGVNCTPHSGETVHPVPVKPYMAFWHIVHDIPAKVYTLL
jgi:hypothetical protein